MEPIELAQKIADYLQEVNKISYRIYTGMPYR